MAFATSSLVNGQWTTTTLDLDTVMRHYNQRDQAVIDPLASEAEIVPQLGVLSQTVVSSPLVHWILAASLRDSKTEDVAFIGDDFVQVRELRPDGTLQDLIRKDDFGSRIRNARVVGSIKAFEDDTVARDGVMQFKYEDDEFYIDEDPSNEDANGHEKQRTLPPQVILLQLVSGDTVFLALCQSRDGGLEFMSSHRKVSKSMLKLQPGMHMAIDPSSRFVALGCSEGVVAIYTLHTRPELRAQYSKATDLQFVASEFRLFITGAILKVAFLYPASDDDEHIILLILVASNGTTRMLVYDWEVGEALSDLRPHSTKGYPLDEEHQLPLLLIPLTIKSSFILVCEGVMSLCLGILQGSPTITVFSHTIDPPTPFHSGLGVPLWTSWTRASRLPSRAATINDIFVVREDGLLKLLELDSTVDEIVKSYNNVGEFDVTCGTALACLYLELGHFTKSGDMFLIGGDGCAGGAYVLPARKNPIVIEPFPNWSPAHDIVTTHSRHGQEIDTLQSYADKSSPPLSCPDRVFACVGKGVNGAIVEFRRGYEAKIHLETDCETPIINSWVFGEWSMEQDDNEAFIFLLSLGDRSKVLRLQNEPEEIEELDETQSIFDLRYPTILASTHEGRLIQVTEKSITIARGAVNKRLGVSDLLHQNREPTAASEISIYKAATDERFVVFALSIKGLVFLQVLHIIDNDGVEEVMDMDLETPSFSSVRNLRRYSSHVTGLTMCSPAGKPHVIVALWTQDVVVIELQPLHDGHVKTFRLVNSSLSGNGSRLGAVASVLVLSSDVDSIQLLCGTHNGYLLALQLELLTAKMFIRRCSRIGATSVMIIADQPSSFGYLATCDSRVFKILSPSLSSSDIERRNWAESIDIHPLWFTDASNLDMQQPKLTSVASYIPSSFSNSRRGLLVTAGSQIMVAALGSQVISVPRRILIGGTPTRLLYSRNLDTLVVAATIKGRSSLLFIDPETGVNLSQPIDQKTKEPVEYASGLGHLNERIFRLFEWTYKKDGKSWNYIITSTSKGRLLIISVEDLDRVRKDIQTAMFHPRETSDGGLRSKISYYTRYKFKSNDPVYSVTEYPDGLIWCSGDKLYCDALDLVAKRFKRVAEYTLPSPAINLTYENGTIFALTLRHSLEVLDLTSDEMAEPLIIRRHGDKITRASLHHLVYPQPHQRRLHLVSDKLGSLVGLWPVQNTKADTMDILFEAQLRSAVLRLRFADCRPPWDPLRDEVRDSVGARHGLEARHILAEQSHYEIIGLSVTGSLTHYTILDLQTWKLLRLFLDLTLRSSKSWNNSRKDDRVPLEDVTSPKTRMHIDGDILKRCLRERLLAKLLQVDRDRIGDPEVYQRFLTLLQEWHEGSLGDHESPSFYIEQAYEDLEYLLRPVL